MGFEPTPLRTGAWSQRLRPLGQTVCVMDLAFAGNLERRLFWCNMREISSTSSRPTPEIRVAHNQVCTAIHCPGGGPCIKSHSHDVPTTLPLIHATLRINLNSFTTSHVKYNSYPRYCDTSSKHFLRIHVIQLHFTLIRGRGNI